jgi:hypothetical protein
MAMKPERITARPEHLGIEYDGWDVIFAPADVEFVEAEGWQDVLINGHLVGSLEARPPYCDRGRWWFKCDLPDLDGADGFPRYYMSLAVARLEIIAFLNWRLWRRRVV